MKTSNLSALCLVWIGYFGCSSTFAAEPPPKSGDLSAEFIYKDNCSVCHGDRGDGRSRASNSLVPPPRDFTEAGSLTREYMIYTVANGKPGTAMTSWKTRLNPQQIEAVVDHVRSKFMQEAIETHFAPGRLAYSHYCKSCHGEQGQGVLAGGLTVAPRSFLVPGARAELSRERMLAAVTRGVPGILKHEFTENLSVDQTWSVIEYVREVLMVDNVAPLPAPTPDTDKTQVDINLPMPKGLIGDARLGEHFFMGNCATCHGTLGDGQGPRAYFMTTKPRNFLDDYSRTTLNRPAIFSAVTHGRLGTEMPAWGKVLTEQEIANVAEFVFRAFIQNKAGGKTSGK